MPRGAEQLDELYNQLLDSFDDDGPDLNLISSLPPNDSRKKSARKETSDSDKLLDLYQSYADEAPPDQYSSRAVHPHNTSVPSNPTPLSIPASPTPMNGTSSRGAAYTQSPPQQTTSPTTSGSSRSSRPLPTPPSVTSRATNSVSTTLTPPLPPSQGQESYQSQQFQLSPNGDRQTYNRQRNGGDSPDSGFSYHGDQPSPSGGQGNELSPAASYDAGHISGSRVAAQRALSGNSGSTKRDFALYGPPQVPPNTGRPPIESMSSTSQYYHTGNQGALTQLPAASQDNYDNYNGNSYPNHVSRTVSAYASSTPPPLPPKPTVQHNTSYSTGGSAATHSSSPSISVTPSDETFSFSSSRRPERDTALSGSSITSVGTTPKTTSPVAMTASYMAPSGSASPTAVSSSTAVTPAVPAASPDWVPSHLQQHYTVSSSEQLRGSMEQDRGEYDFVGDDDFSLNSDNVDDFFNSSLLSHIAVKLRDKVSREVHVKGGIPYHNAFTGRDVVSTIQSIIQRDLPDIASDGRRTALSIARSLQKQLFFNEVEWDDRDLTDGVEDVYSFLDDQHDNVAGASSGILRGVYDEREELPNGIITTLTKCYVSTCGESDQPCYAWSCPRRVKPSSGGGRMPPEGLTERTEADERGWSDGMDPAILSTLPKSEVARQSVIFRTISQEAKYLRDLDLIASLYVKPLRLASPSIIDPGDLDSFIECVFGNILDLRETSRRILEKLYVRQREQGPFIQYIGDIFLTAATEFRVVYPKYVGNLVRAGQRVKDELDQNASFRTFHDECVRLPEARRLDLRHLITRPSDHLQRYPVLLDAIRNETTEGNPDAEYLLEASEAIRKLSTMAQVRAFQVSMLKGPAGDQEWYHLVAPDVRERLSKQEVKRQLVIFELIKSEMEYVRDLEMIQTLFVRPLRAAKLPLPDPSERGVDDFLRDIFHNYQEILEHQRRLLTAFFEIQSEEYPCVDSIVAPIFDAALNWQDAYMEYTTHYPIAEYRVEEAMAMPEFRAVIEEAQRHPDARKLPIKSFINRPVSRILRYDLLLKRVLDATAETHEDQKNIPEVLRILKDLSKSLDHAIVAPKRKVEMWRYHRNLVWRPGEEMNLDLLDETRQLVHTGRVLRQPEGGFELGGWTELFVLLFDNYLVMTKAKEKDGIVKYHVNKRPIPLELLTLLSFNDAPIQRNTSLLSGLRSGGGRAAASSQLDMSKEAAEAVDHRLVFPCSVYHSGRVGGHYQLFAESANTRAEWKQKLEEAIGLRKVVLENNKAFEITTISKDTFAVASLQSPAAGPTWDEGQFTGKVTCSVPLKAANGRDLVAVGCAEGVWIGLRHDSTSMRRVLHLKHVTQCAMLEDFGIFLVLADKYLFAYHIEALVPTGPPGPNAQREPQRLNRNRDVQFFTVGTLNDRTLIIYMKKKGLDSVFRVLEPVTEKIAEKTKSSNFSRSIFGTQKSEWFREYKEFFLPSEAYDLIFLKVKIAILCAKGFEIMDLVAFNSVTIPQRDDPRHLAIAKRCESRKPMGMFRSAENEFLLCYDEFGVYVDRHGDATSRQVGVIEWEGTAERVAFHPPYVIIFDSRFIEIRHIAQGKLVQIIQGTDVHCTWDGRGYLSRSNPAAHPSTPGPGGWDENTQSNETRIHAVMKAEGVPATGANRGTIAQHVFELSPTQLLYAPATLQSQTSAGYFQTSNPIISPVRSPRPSSVATGWSR